MARPKLKIDKVQVEKLAQIGATNAELAGFFGCSTDTIERRFAAILKKARESGKIRLRQLQWKMVESGNWKMMIWLGKQLLGQTEKVDATTGGESMRPLNVQVNNAKAAAALGKAIADIGGE